MNALYIVTSITLEEPVVYNRVVPYIKHALGSGLAVRLISPAGGQFPDFLGGDFQHLELEVIDRRKASFLARAIHEWVLARRLLAQVPADKSVGVLITIPSMFLLFASRKPKMGYSFLDVRDLTWEYLSEKAIITRWAKRLFRYLSRRSVGKFDLVTVTNSTEERYVCDDLGVKESRVVRVPNGISQFQFDRLAHISPKVEEKAAIRVAYIGNVGIAQNLQILLEAARSLPDMIFEIAGEGTDFARISKLCDDWELTNVRLLGRLSWDQIPDLYQRSDILYAQLSADFSGAMPSKLYEYLASGRFIIYGGLRQAVEALRDFDNSRVVPPDDAAALIEALTEVALSGEWHNLSLGNRQIIEKKFIREKCVEPFFSRLKSSISEEPAR
jgi:glycosyltransferase involved in cell wall biosynthesis